MGLVLADLQLGSNPTQTSADDLQRESRSSHLLAMKLPIPNAQGVRVQHAEANTVIKYNKINKLNCWWARRAD